MFAIDKTARLFFVTSLLLTSSVAEKFDTTPAWPLCGRIAENPPANWKPEDGCPSDRWGNPDYSDAPFSSTFGPRQKASESYRYDFHRGVDIPSANLTPVFAIAKGVVRKSGYDPAYSDPLIQLRHYRPDYWGSCYRGSGCYASNYMHLSQWVVSIGDVVEKGDLIGYTGESESGFGHLHFEIRDAPGKHDAYSAWQRDAIHPLKVLPYHDTDTENIALTIDSVDRTVPTQPIVTVTATLLNSAELDLNNIELELYQKESNGSLTPVPQSGEISTRITPESIGYYLNPSWYDIEQFNRQYSYKNSSKYPWSSFQCGGSYESPYCNILPSSYNANIHLDHATSYDHKVGDFNGLLIAPSQFNTYSSNYRLTITFTQLDGVEDGKNLCVKASAYDILGNKTVPVEFNCSNE